MMINPETSVLMLQASGASMPWWQVISGVLAIPATMLGLVYTYRLYQKTHLEMRRLELEIREKERELGLEKESATEPPALPDSSAPLSEPSVKRSQVLDSHPLHLVLTVGAIIASLCFAWIMPGPFPLSTPIRTAERVAFLALVLITILVSTVILKRKSPWVLAAVASAAFIFSMLAVFSFLYLRAQYMVRFDLPDETIEFLAGTTLSAPAKAYLARDPQLTNENLLKGFGLNNASEIWTPESIAIIQRSLIALYIASIILVSILILTITKLVQFAWSKRSDRSKAETESAVTDQLPTQTAQRLEQRSQLEVLGLIASSIEHDLKTPLSSLAMQIKSMRRKFAHNEEMVRSLDKLDQELSVSLPSLR